MLFAPVYSRLRLLLDLVDVRLPGDELEAELPLLRHQLRVLRRQVKRLQLNPADRAIIAALSKRVSWAALAGMLAQTETVLGWHRQLVRRKWAAFGRRRGPGRPAWLSKPPGRPGGDPVPVHGGHGDVPEPLRDPTRHLLGWLEYNRQPGGCNTVGSVGLDEAAGNMRAMVEAGQRVESDSYRRRRGDMVVVMASRALVVATLVEELGLRLRPGCAVGQIDSDGSLSELVDELADDMHRRAG